MFHHSTQINPIFKQGSYDAAVLLIHGFTGTPDSMRPLANSLHDEGFTVSVPLLAGHGTTRENLARSGWQDWYDTAATHFLDLKQHYSAVFVGGLSLGGLLALRLAQVYPQEVTALASLATPLTLSTWVTLAVPLIVHTPLKFVYPYQRKAKADVKDPNARKNYWSIHDMPITCIHSLMQLQHLVRQELARVVCPTLLIHSRYDATAPYKSMNDIAKNISANITETITLKNSFHLVTIDYDKNLVGQRVGAFFLRFLKHLNRDE